MRPRTLDEIVGQPHLVGPGAPLRALIEADRLSSIILWGPPGTGKTTLASVVAAMTDREFMAMSAVNAGVRDVREVIAAARQRLADDGRGTILFLDEVHRFNKSQQDALLPAVESGVLTLIGATTENPFFEVNAPLISRSTIFRLQPLSPDDLGVGVDPAPAAPTPTPTPARAATPWSRWPAATRGPRCPRSRSPWRSPRPTATAPRSRSTTSSGPARAGCC